MIKDTDGSHSDGLNDFLFVCISALISLKIILGYAICMNLELYSLPILFLKMSLAFRTYLQIEKEETLLEILNEIYQRTSIIVSLALILTNYALYHN